MENFKWLETLNNNIVFVYNTSPKKTFYVYVREENKIKLPLERWKCHELIRRNKRNENKFKIAFFKNGDVKKSILSFLKKKFDIENIVFDI